MPEEAKLNYLGTWKGRVIKAIAIDGAYTWNEIRENTGLSPNKLNVVLKELFNVNALKKVEQENRTEYRVEKNLYNQYRNYYEEIEEKENVAPIVKITEQRQKELYTWIDTWKDQERLNIELNNKHFFLEGEHLDEFARKMIANAKEEVLTTAPWVQKISLSEALVKAVKNGAKVTLLTRTPNEEGEKYYRYLREEGIRICKNEEVHAKIIVIDRTIAIVSSLNFTQASSAGKSWEAGIVTLESSVVEDTINAILGQIERKDSKKEN